MIVDDHEGFRRQAALLLAGDSFDVVGLVKDGESAVGAARSLSPEVVLVDVQLPGIDGFEVTRRLLGEPRPPMVILISSRDRSDYGQRIDDCGAAGFLAKSELGPAAVGELMGSDR